MIRHCKLTFAAAFTLIWALIPLVSCGGSNPPLIEDLQGSERFPLFQITATEGVREGDRLNVRAMLSDTSSMLTMEIRFAIGSPTTLESGNWWWVRDNRVMQGKIAARSVHFLGGQSGPPSIGGIFDLVSEGGDAQYRVTIPPTELKNPERP